MDKKHTSAEPSTALAWWKRAQEPGCANSLAQRKFLDFVREAFGKDKKCIDIDKLPTSVLRILDAMLAHKDSDTEGKSAHGQSPLTSEISDALQAISNCWRAVLANIQEKLPKVRVPKITVRILGGMKQNIAALTDNDANNYLEEEELEDCDCDSDEEEEEEHAEGSIINVDPNQRRRDLLFRQPEAAADTSALLSNANERDLRQNCVRLDLCQFRQVKDFIKARDQVMAEGFKNTENHYVALITCETQTSEESNVSWNGETESVLHLMVAVNPQRLRVDLDKRSESDLSKKPCIFCQNTVGDRRVVPVSHRRGGHKMRLGLYYFKSALFLDRLDATAFHGGMPGHPWKFSWRADDRGRPVPSLVEHP